MAVRIEAIEKLKKEALCTGKIALTKDGGKKAARSEEKAATNFANKRKERLLHELATHFRVWVLGGSRYAENSPESTLAQNIARALVSELSVDILTGAGPGIMDAAASGLKKARERTREGLFPSDARNFGIDMKFPWQEDKEAFDYYRQHPELLTRVQELVDLSHAAYVGPGSIGTAFELWVLIQLKQLHHLEESYALIVHPSWKAGIKAYRKNWYEDRMKRGEKPLMGENDLNITFSDSIPEIVGIMRESYNQWNESIGKHVRYRRRSFWKRNLSF